MPAASSQGAEASDRGMPRWPGIIALIAISAVYLLISRQRTIGPPWLFPSLLGLTLLAALLAEQQHAHRVRRRLVIGATVAATAILALGVALLVNELLFYGAEAVALLRDGVLLWCLNIVTFALWYWELDGGGPDYRSRSMHSSTDFLFPQMQLADREPWTPTFVDYLFLAFNTNTALSPTDTLILSRPAKLLMMAQSSIALVVVVVIAARAVSTLSA